MKAKAALEAQFLATLAMLNQVVDRCPDDIWDDPADENRVWHVAYHALFYAHLYLSPKDEAMEPWPKARENYNVLGDTMPFPPHDPVDHSIPYSKADIREYIDFCRDQVRKQIAAVDLEAAESGFFWIPLSKFELQLYNMRHLQSHVGELAHRLWIGGVSTDWIGQAE